MIQDPSVMFFFVFLFFLEKIRVKNVKKRKKKIQGLQAVPVQGRHTIHKPRGEMPLGKLQTTRAKN
jgi:hypothetical protein